MAQNPPFTGNQSIDTVIDIIERDERARTEPTPAQEDLGQPYQAVKSLVWARQHPVYGVALAEWERQERLFSARVERREKSSADLTNQIFNLVGFFSGFQGLVLTAVTQLSGCKSQCHKVWFPIVLTVVAAIVTVVGVLQKFHSIKELKESIRTEKRAQAEVIRRQERVRTDQKNFRFYEVKELPPLRKKKFWNNLGMIGVLGALIIFTIIFVLSYLTILCW